MVVPRWWSLRRVGRRREVEGRPETRSFGGGLLTPTPQNPTQGRETMGNSGKCWDGKTPGQWPFLRETPGQRIGPICLHTATVMSRFRRRRGPSVDRAGIVFLKRLSDVRDAVMRSETVGRPQSNRFDPCKRLVRGVGQVGCVGSVSEGGA